MEISHKEAVLLARLLGHHVSGIGIFENLGQRLLEYAKSMGEDTSPLPLKPASRYTGHPDRVMFRCDSDEKGI